MILPTPNLDLGRALRWADIQDKDSQPITDEDSGAYCYCCQEEQGFRLDELQPLTPSSGIFTRAVLCQMEAPVYVCLEHIPIGRNEFDAFTPEVAQALRDARVARDAAWRQQMAEAHRKADRPEGTAR